MIDLHPSFSLFLVSIDSFLKKHIFLFQEYLIQNYLIAITLSSRKINFSSIIHFYIINDYY